MRTILAFIAGSLLCVASANAQEIVYDPSLHTQNIINQAANIAKYVQMINNQIQQINTLPSQLNELQHYNQIFGDPSKIVNLAGFTGLITDLHDTGVGQAIGSLQSLSQGIDALKYDADGLYHNVGEMFTTPHGNSVSRNQTSYRPFAAVNETTKNFSDVYADVIARRQSLKQDIAATTAQLRTPSHRRTTCRAWTLRHHSSMNSQTKTNPLLKGKTKSQDGQSTSSCAGCAQSVRAIATATTPTSPKSSVHVCSMCSAASENVARYVACRPLQFAHSIFRFAHGHESWM